MCIVPESAFLGLAWYLVYLDLLDLTSFQYHHHAAGTSSLVSFRNGVQVPLYCWMFDVPIAPDCSIDEEPIENQHSLRVFSFGYTVQNLLVFLGQMAQKDLQKAEVVDRMCRIKEGCEIEESVVISDLAQISFRRVAPMEFAKLGACVVEATI
ncbi:hypothetical protein Tco_1244157 [Tanacetum coccineum]